jgi:hypothetical protein
MVKSVTMAILVSTWAILLGLLFPGLVAYSIVYFRRCGHQFKTVLLFCAKLLLILITFAFFEFLILLCVGVVGETAATPIAVLGWSLFIGLNVGLWGGIAGLVIGFRRAHRAAPTP